MATYAIGDVQGCARTLDALLAQIDFDPARDTAWFAGDLVNRGTGSLAALRRIIGLGSAAHVVLGNHDLHLLARAAGAPARRGDTLDDILQAPDAADLIDWVRRQPLAWHGAGWLMIHAGLDPGWRLADALEAARRCEMELRSAQWRSAIERLPAHETAMLTRARLLYSDGAPAWGFKGPPEAAPADETPWFAHSRIIAEGEAKVVFGHWAALDFRRGAGWISLDSGCVWGRRLTAFCLETGRAVHQPTDPADVQ